MLDCCCFFPFDANFTRNVSRIEDDLVVNLLKELINGTPVGYRIS